MIIIAAVDERNGILFNGRRQSQDRILRDHILDMTKKTILWMNNYSYKQFASAEEKDRIRTDEDFMNKAGDGEFCFIENISVLPYENKIEKIILFKWNRVYPGDFYFDIDLSSEKWKVTETEEFAGSSHKKITKEVYEK